MHIGEMAEEQQPEGKPGDAPGELKPTAHLHTGLKRSKRLEQTETGVTLLVFACYFFIFLSFVTDILSCFTIIIIFFPFWWLSYNKLFYLS